MRDVEVRPRPPSVYVTIFAIGAIGVLIKRPFGLFLFHLMGKQQPSFQTPLQWLMSDYGSLLIVAIACVLHRYSGLPLAPRIERLFFSEARTEPKSPMWRPGLIGAGICLLIFLASQLYQTLSRTPAAPISAKLNTGAIPHAELIKLMALYPLAFVGAALSEEVFYRFGFLSVLMGLMSFLRLGGRNPNNAIAFWIANLIQGGWFGYIHVQQGIVAAQNGSLPFQIAVAPQTWAGVVFGIVYRRFGLEAAIVAHMATDILAPIALALWGHFIH